MSENTEIAEKRLPKPQRFRWKNIAYYNTFEEAHLHRLKIEEENIVKIRRCAPDRSRFVVKVGSPVKEKSGE